MNHFFSPLFLLFGFGLGAVQFGTLHRNVRLYTEAASTTPAVVFHVARLMVAALGWFAIARLGGAGGLISGLVGFLVARPVVSRLVGGNA